ncbi:MAG: hypothetical protein SOW90_01140 [Gallibacter sp.]|nr:hypothetical protein [Gallibacter sp.]
MINSSMIKEIEEERVRRINLTRKDLEKAYFDLEKDNFDIDKMLRFKADLAGSSDIA